MKKVLILGPSGTGKTTLCRELGEKMNLEILHLDEVYWKKDWENINKEDFDVALKNFLRKKDKWVIDGNYSNNAHFKYRLDVADTIIYLDYGVNAALQGIHKRARMYKHITRSDMADGCIEGIDQIFLQYVAFYDYRNKMLKAIVNRYKNKKKIMIFKSREKLHKWFNAL